MLKIRGLKIDGKGIQFRGKRYSYPLVGGVAAGLIAVLVILGWVASASLSKPINDTDVAAKFSESGSAESLAPASLPVEGTVITRIAFGSCLDENGPLEILNAVLERQPQLFIFEGDNVYVDAADDKIVGEASNIVTSPLMIRAAYATLGAQPAYQTFRSRVPIIATWDDHDFGLNDVGENFAYKQASKEAFSDFFGVPKDSERYTQPDGIYTAYTFGPEGQRVQVILLDTRWNRSALLPTDEPNAPGKERFMPDPDPTKTILGEAQWAWLEQKLIEPADVRLIVSSVQVLAEGHGWERWGNFPRERDRLMKVLQDTDAKNIVLLSGDRHAAAIYKNDNALGYSLYEVTSSSLNKPLRASQPEPPNEQDPQRLKPLYIDENFGVVEIDWGARSVALELRDKAGQLIQGVTMPFADEIQAAQP